MFDQTKARVKNFYRRHDDFIHLTTIYLVGSAALIYTATDIIKGMHVTGAEFMTDADKKPVLIITKKNGTSSRLYQNHTHPES